MFFSIVQRTLNIHLYRLSLTHYVVFKHRIRKHIQVSLNVHDLGFDIKNKNPLSSAWSILGYIYAECCRIQQTNSEG